MKKSVFVLIAFAFLFSAFKSLGGLLSVPDYFPAPVYDFSKKPLEEAKIELGRALFYDPILSQNNTISCSSCHSSYNAFAHVDHDLSHGIHDQIGTRNAPALMNLAWQKSFMWDGAINHLDVQALAPISHPKEMGEQIANVVTKLQQTKLYPPLFYKAFGDSVITGEHILLALSQFQLTLVSVNSKYDSVMQHEAVFTEQQQRGYDLFKKNCNSCHREPLFSTYEFRNNGLAVDTTLNDYGKMKITKRPEDSLLFKIPTLRNLEYTYPYMHDGRFKRLTEVINHYTSGIEKSKTLAPELRKPIVMSSNEKVDLVAFLLTLSDRKFVFNPDYSYPSSIFFPKPKDR